MESYVKISRKLKLIFEIFYQKWSGHAYKRSIEFRVSLWKIMWNTSEKEYCYLNVSIENSTQNIYENKNAFLTIQLDVNSKSLKE